jgi:15-cis-phytoene desaturase
MEGAVLGGKLAAEVLARKAANLPAPELANKPVRDEIVQKAQTHEARPPAGVKGQGAIAFGGGAVLGTENKALLRDVDPSQFVEA